jgi:hypothetical protein
MLEIDHWLYFIQGDRDFEILSLVDTEVRKS